jgi:hypothetical protein
MAGKPLGFGTRLLNLTTKQYQVKPSNKIRPHTDVYRQYLVSIYRGRLTVEDCDWMAA